MSILIRGGRILDPANRLDFIGDLLVHGRHIAAVGEIESRPENTEIIDAAGKLVTPGLVDLSAHLREPGQEHKATVDSETRAAAAGGITTLCCPPDTRPAIDAPAEVELLRQRAIQAGRAWVAPLGGMTMGLKGEALSEMAALQAAGCVGISNGRKPILNTKTLFRALEYASTFDLTVHIQPQDHWLTRGGLAHEGRIASRLGLPGIPSAAETTEITRVLALAEAAGARIHFGRLSTARGVELVAEAQARNVAVTADVGAHQLFLTENDLAEFDPQCHLDPPLRTQEDREALRRGVRDGIIAAVCSDHQPHEADAKDAPLAETEPGLSGLETLLPLGLRLVQDGWLDLPALIDRLSAAPARILGVPGGVLSPGAGADLCIIDPDQVWRLDPDQMISRGRNTPFGGWEFTGRAVYTLFEGRAVHRAETLI